MLKWISKIELNETFSNDFFFLLKWVIKMKYNEKWLDKSLVTEITANMNNYKKNKKRCKEIIKIWQSDLQEFEKSAR